MDNNTSETLTSLLSREDCTIELLMDEDDLIQELNCSNASLLKL